MTPRKVAIDGHVRLLLAWTRAINLTAIREPAAVATGHVVDSLSAVPWLPGPGAGPDPGPRVGRRVPRPAARGRACRARRDAGEPIGKKAAVPARRWSRRRASGSGRPVTPIARRRSRRTAARRGTWAVVTARAVASTADLVELAFPLLARGRRLVAWKRGDLDGELAAAARAAEAGSVAARSSVLDVAVADLTATTGWWS